MVVATANVFRNWGAEVVVGEGPGHMRDTEMALIESGLQDALADADLRFVDLNYSQLGYITGFYFALFYCFIAIPIGWLADRTNRVKILSLACGLIGIVNKLKAEPPVLTTANEDEIDLPRGLLEAVALFEEDEALHEMLGKQFCSTYAAIKRAEFETFMEVISPWEREYLLLNV